MKKPMLLLALQNQIQRIMCPRLEFGGHSLGSIYNKLCECFVLTAIPGYCRHRLASGDWRGNVSKRLDGGSTADRYDYPRQNLGDALHGHVTSE